MLERPRSGASAMRWHAVTEPLLNVQNAGARAHPGTRSGDGSRETPTPADVTSNLVSRGFARPLGWASQNAFFMTCMMSTAHTNSLAPHTYLTHHTYLHSYVLATTCAFAHAGYSSLRTRTRRALQVQQTPPPSRRHLDLGVVKVWRGRELRRADHVVVDCDVGVHLGRHHRRRHRGGDDTNRRGDDGGGGGLDRGHHIW